MSAVRITDAAGQTYSIDGCDTISQLKDAILEHTGIPVEQQHLTRSGDSRELRDGDEVSADEELEMLVDLSGGCEVKPFFIKIQNFECQFRYVTQAQQRHADTAEGRLGRWGAAPGGDVRES